MLLVTLLPELNEQFFVLFLFFLFFFWYKWDVCARGEGLVGKVHVKSLQLCLTLGDPMDPHPPGSSVHGILQARRREWVSVPSSGGFS